MLSYSFDTGNDLKLDWRIFALPSIFRIQIQ